MLIPIALIVHFTKIHQSTCSLLIQSKIFQPILDMHGLDNQVFSSAEEFIPLFANRVSWVNTMIQNPPEKSNEEYAKLMYIEMIKSMVSGTVFGEMERSVHGYVGPAKKKSDNFSIEERKRGIDWAYIGDTMTGYARLDNVRDLLMDVLKNNVEGGYIGKSISYITVSILHAKQLLTREPYHIQRLECGVVDPAFLPEQYWLHLELLIAFPTYVTLLLVCLQVTDPLIKKT